MKKLFITTGIVLLLVSAAGVKVYAQKDADKLKSEIKSMNDKMAKASVSNNMDYMKSYYCDNVISLPNNGPQVSGLSQLMAKNKEDMQAGYKMISLDLKTDNIFPDKMYVIETGHYDISMSMPKSDKPMNDKGKYITVWERQTDGSLKVLIETWNTDTNPMGMDMKKEMSEQNED
jgi:ketosteroid isomerase-like protein